MVSLKQIESCNKYVFNSSLTIEQLKENRLKSFYNYFNKIENEDCGLLEDIDRLKEMYSFYLYEEKEIVLDFKNIKKEELKSPQYNIVFFTIPLKNKSHNYLTINYGCRFSKKNIFSITGDSLSFVYDFNQENELTIEEFEKKVIYHLKKDIDYINSKIFSLNDSIKKEIDDKFQPYLNKKNIFNRIKEIYINFQYLCNNHKVGIWLMLIGAGLSAILGVVLTYYFLM